MSKYSSKGVGIMYDGFYEIELSMWDIVVIKLNKNASILLMDYVNYDKYKRSLPHKYYGGHATPPSFRISAPNAGKWYVVIKPEKPENINHSIQIIRN